MILVITIIQIKIIKKMIGIMDGVQIILPTKKILKMITGIMDGAQIQIPTKMIIISNQNQYQEMTSKKVLWMLIINIEQNTMQEN